MNKTRRDYLVEIIYNGSLGKMYPSEVGYYEHDLIKSGYDAGYKAAIDVVVEALKKNKDYYAADADYTYFVFELEQNFKKEQEQG